MKNFMNSIMKKSFVNMEKIDNDIKSLETQIKKLADFLDLLDKQKNSYLNSLVYNE
jgi:hypothetical protein